MQKWPFLKFIIWNTQVPWCWLQKKGIKKNQAWTVSSSGQYPALYHSSIRKRALGRNQKAVSSIKASLHQAFSSGYKNQCQPRWLTIRSMHEEQRNCPLFSNTVRSRSCNWLPVVKPHYSEGKFLEVREPLSEGFANFSSKSYVTAHIWTMSLSIDSENYAMERYPSSLSPWSLQGQRNKDGVYNKTIGRIQPTKLYTLTGTFFLLEYDRSVVLPRSFYLALTSLIAKVVRAIAWRLPQTAPAVCPECLNTAPASLTQLLQTQQRTTTTVWVSLFPPSVMTFC